MSFTDELHSFYNSESFILLIIFSLCFYILLEILFPLYRPRGNYSKRWILNSSLYIINTGMMYLFFLIIGDPFEKGGIEGFGLFYWLPTIPFVVQFLIFFLVVDLIQYGLHALNHHWRPLWRIHMPHHTDTDLDSGSSFRHHPFELILESAVRIFTMILFGATLPLLILYDIFYACHSFFTHANIKIPITLEKTLRLVFVTPDMHRVHHSAYEKETNTNYGNVFSFWDRLFKTHCTIPQKKQKTMRLGLNYFRGESDQTLIGFLMQPLRYSKSIIPLQEKAIETKRTL